MSPIVGFCCRPINVYCSMVTTLLGLLPWRRRSWGGPQPPIPLDFTATVAAKLTHKAGAVAIAKAAKKAGVVYTLTTLSSYTLDEMLAARSPGQELFSQLYANLERTRARRSTGRSLRPSA